MESSGLAAWFEALLSAQSKFSLSLVHLSGRVRMSPGWAIENARLPNHLFYFVAEGGFFAIWDGQTHHIAAGDLLWVDKDTPIFFSLDQSENLVVWRFRLNAFDAAGVGLAAAHRFWHVSPARGCEVWIKNLLEEAATAAARSNERLRGLLLCLFTELERSATTAASSGLLTSTQQQTLRTYLGHCTGKWPSPADLAHQVELSPDYFTRCFRRTYGLAPRRFLLEERMRQATIQLLESSASVSQIARDLGYEDIFSFSRQFKAVQGVSPSHFRRQQSAIAAL